MKYKYYDSPKTPFPMKIHDLKEAQARFENRMERFKEERKKLHNIRRKLVNHYTIDRISKMDIDDYVLGVETYKSETNFCYTLEWRLDELGRISGAPADKFGVYYGRKKGQDMGYQFSKKFGNNYEEAFENVRSSLIELIRAGQNDDFDTIKKNKFSPMVKGKILSTYFPEKHLNIFSDDHLNHFLIQFDLDSKDLLKSDPVEKRAELVSFKDNDPVMKDWSVDLFSHFLYTEYPGLHPKNYNDSDPLDDYRNPSFPTNQSAEFINLNILPQEKRDKPFGNDKSGGGNKPDYEKNRRQLERLGDRGEKVVMDLEISKLKDEGREELASKVERVSLESDSYGYDILSFEKDGSKKYIEVKATRGDVGSANFYYTANELATAEKYKEQYSLYMVYKIDSESPKVWIIGNPFYPHNNYVSLSPILYQATINASR